MLFKVTFRGFRGKSDHTLLFKKIYKLKRQKCLNGLHNKLFENSGNLFKILETLKVAMKKLEPTKLYIFLG